MNKIIYYYQSFLDLGEDFINDCKATHIIVSSLHFDYDTDKETGKQIPSIYLNDNHTGDKKFDMLWGQMAELHEKGVIIMVMLGGAGGAYEYMFKDYDVFYALLIDFLKNKPFISGIDLDIEETVELDNVKRVINDLDQQFPKDFIITMAPLGDSLAGDNPGMGNFIYKDLYACSEGQRINWFNGQFYGNFSLEAYSACIKNGFPQEKVVIGMLGYSNYREVNETIQQIKLIKAIYPEFGGVDVWELYYTTKTGNIGYWANEMFKAIYLELSENPDNYDKYHDIDLNKINKINKINIKEQDRYEELLDKDIANSGVKCCIC
jgi:hypothetical protein